MGYLPAPLLVAQPRILTTTMYAPPCLVTGLLAEALPCRVAPVAYFGLCRRANTWGRAVFERACRRCGWRGRQTVSAGLRAHAGDFQRPAVPCAVPAGSGTSAGTLRSRLHYSPPAEVGHR